MISWLLDQVCRLILISLTFATSNETYLFHSARQLPKTPRLQVKPLHPFRATTHQLQSSCSERGGERLTSPLAIGMKA